ncbi:hypothetical protein M0812_20646 [Anaeramoeba flamelloides]|uniref:Uncharacterized protein n=1 Tax=Anaeramoeba flamelloides TaxID=1746091 RepID=A0AAV7YPL1_9EUKA|nr:hypothetical protein M0812_20646 [Anaeramoeba flamelloides]
MYKSQENFQTQKIKSESTLRETQLIEKLQNERSIGERLVLFLELYPNSIVGISKEQLQSEEKKILMHENIHQTATWKNEDQNNNTPNNENRHCNLETTKSSKRGDWNQDIDSPKEIKIKRIYLTKLSKHTGRSRRTLERGISSFCFRRFGFVNIRPYSSDYLVFGKLEIDPNQRVQTKTKKTSRKKKLQKKRKKKKITIKSNKNVVLNQEKTVPCNSRFNFRVVANNQSTPMFINNNLGEVNHNNSNYVCQKTFKPKNLDLVVRKRNFFQNYLEKQNFSKLQMLSEVSHHLKQLRSNPLNHRNIH